MKHRITLMVDVEPPDGGVVAPFVASALMEYAADLERGVAGARKQERHAYKILGVEVTLTHQHHNGDEMAEIVGRNLRRDSVLQEGEKVIVARQRELQALILRQKHREVTWHRKTAEDSRSSECTLGAERAALRRDRKAVHVDRKAVRRDQATLEQAMKDIDARTTLLDVREDKACDREDDFLVQEAAFMARDKAEPAPSTPDVIYMEPRPIERKTRRREDMLDQAVRRARSGLDELGREQQAKGRRWPQKTYQHVADLIINKIGGHPSKPHLSGGVLGRIRKEFARIAKPDAPVMRPGDTSNRRSLEAWRLHGEGLSLEAIAHKIGRASDPTVPISATRARQLVYRGEQHQRVAEVAA